MDPIESLKSLTLSVSITREELGPKGSQSTPPSWWIPLRIRIMITVWSSKLFRTTGARRLRTMLCRRRRTWDRAWILIHNRVGLSQVALTQPTHPKWSLTKPQIYPWRRQGSQSCLQRAPTAPSKRRTINRLRKCSIRRARMANRLIRWFPQNWRIVVRQPARWPENLEAALSNPSATPLANELIDTTDFMPI